MRDNIFHMGSRREESEGEDIENDGHHHSPSRERYNRRLMQTPKHNRPCRQEEVGSQNDNNTITPGARRIAKDGTPYIQDMQQNDPPKEIVGGFRKVQESPYVHSLQDQGNHITPKRHPFMLNGDVAANYGSPVGRSRQQHQETEDRQYMQPTGQRDNRSIPIIPRRGLSTPHIHDGSPQSRSFQQLQESGVMQQQQHKTRKGPQQPQPKPPLQHVQNQATLQLRTQQLFSQQQMQNSSPQQRNQWQQMQQTPQYQPAGSSNVPNPFHSSPQHFRKRPYNDDHETSELPRATHGHDHSITPSQANGYYVFDQGIMQQSPVAFVQYHTPFTAHSTPPVFTIQPHQSTVPISSSTPIPHYHTSDSTVQLLHSSAHSPSCLPSPEIQSATMPITPHSVRKLAAASVSQLSSKKKTRVTDDEIAARIKGAQAAFGGTSSWCQLYKTVQVGYLPTAEQFAAFPPPDSLKNLLKVPIYKATRNDSELGHFYSKEVVNGNNIDNNNGSNGSNSDHDNNNVNDDNSNSDSNADNDNNDSNIRKGKGGGCANKDNDNNRSKSKDKNNNTDKGKKSGNGRDYYCQMVIKPATATQPAVRCGKKYASGTNNRSRKRHLDTAHPGVRSTMCNFRLLQLTVQSPEKLMSNKDPDSAVHPCECGGAERDQKIFSDMIINLISTTSVSMEVVQSKAFRDLIHYANPNLIVRDPDTLWQHLEDKTQEAKAILMTQLHQDSPNGSITADSWTSQDGRKFQAVTYHYLTPEFTMGKVLVGMDQIEEPEQKAEVLLKSLRTSLQDWNLEDKVVSATTDQGSNVKKCMSLYSTTSASKLTWLPCAAHKIQIAINNAWKVGGAEPLLEKCQKISKLFKNKDFLANRLARSQKNAEENELKPVSMGTTRWNSRYEMTKRIFKMKDHITAIVKHFTDNPTDLPLHINKDKVKNCLLSPEEVDTLEDIINLLEKASKYGNETGASTIPTISTMYTNALNLLPNRSTMTTTIGKAVYDCLDAGIKSRWSLAPPVRPVEPKPKSNKDGTFSPVSAGKLDEYNKQMEVFNITTRQLNTLLVAMYLDPNLINDKLWDDEHAGITVRNRAEELLRVEVVKEINKIRRRSNLEERDMSQAAIGDVGRYVDEAKDVLFKHANLYKSRPHDFWKKYKVLLPTLAEVARRFLCVQSTSCESERIFSRAGYLTADRRAHLGTNHLRDLLFSRSIASATQVLQEERKEADRMAGQKPGIP